MRLIRLSWSAGAVETMLIAERRGHRLELLDVERLARAAGRRIVTTLQVELAEALGPVPLRAHVRSLGRRGGRKPK